MLIHSLRVFSAIPYCNTTSSVPLAHLSAAVKSSVALVYRKALKNFVYYDSVDCGINSTG